MLAPSAHHPVLLGCPFLATVPASTTVTRASHGYDSLSVRLSGGASSDELVCDSLLSTQRRPWPREVNWGRRHRCQAVFRARVPTSCFKTGRGCGEGPLHDRGPLPPSAHPQCGVARTAAPGPEGPTSSSRMTPASQMLAGDAARSHVPSGREKRSEEKKVSLEPCRCTARVTFASVCFALAARLKTKSGSDSVLTSVAEYTSFLERRSNRGVGGGGAFLVTFAKLLSRASDLAQLGLARTIRT